MSGGWHSFTTLPPDWPEQQWRLRQHKVERLLETVDISPEDFILWLRENLKEAKPE